MMIVAVVGIYEKLIIAGITESRAYHTSIILAWLAVKRQHHLGMRGVGVAQTVLILIMRIPWGTGSSVILASSAHVP